MSPVTQAPDDRARLVSLLQAAAQVEHCLLLSYLYAACSLKSTPQEFEALADGQPNRRRAIQFERARDWKQKLMSVAVEEMLHLHYVQCLLRALGESPCFVLPERDAQGDWVIPAWELFDSQAPARQSGGAHIALGPATPDQIQQFVLYESADELQGDDPSGSQFMGLFERLFAGELDLHFETMLLNVADQDLRAQIKSQLNALYAPVPPVRPVAPGHPSPAPPRPLLGPQAFQSIRDLYARGIEPLYKLAFENNWVTHSNRMLNDELFDPNYAGHTGGRLVPVGPVTRSKRFGRLTQKGADDPLRNFKRLDEIVQVILDQGEGVTGFEARVHLLLDEWQKSGTRPYAQGLAQWSLSGGVSPTENSAPHEILRQSHLYRFAMILQGMIAEQCCSDDPDFDPCRKPLDVDANPVLQHMARELPAQVNACYLVLVAWMARVYEIQNWIEDAPRRKAIEMVASWTLMSLAMRPLLEMASFLPCDSGRFFSLEAGAAGSPQARLFALSGKADRTAMDNTEMDQLAVAVLASAAGWAAQQIAAVRGEPIPDPAKRMILSRLQSLSQLDEFEKQFPYRVAGGYSDRMPSLQYRQQFHDSARYEEDPREHKPPSQKPQDTPPPQAPVFDNTLVLRFRFSGWGLSQLATDPDPAGDEAGCSGMTMLHAADGDRRFDRSIVWQDSGSGHAILRQPRDQMPQIGVHCTGISLLAANGPAQVGYIVIPGLQPPSVLQTSPVQQKLSVGGLLEVLTLPTQEILGAGRKMRVELKERSGVKPSYIGLNHLVWQDCEPIDPFVLSMQSDPLPPEAWAAGDAPRDRPSLVLKREVFNQGLSLLEMDPLQRLLSARGPCGVEFGVANIPQWAWPPEPLQAPGYPLTYLAQRAGVLTGALSARLNSGVDSQADVDQAVSLAERLLAVTAPSPVALGWLLCITHYAHSLSGDLALGSGLREVCSSFAARTNLQLGVDYGGSRYVSNNRWLVNYALGVMDVDALSNLVWGELFVPVTLAVAGPIKLTAQWTFPAAMESAVGAVACQFSKPFWAAYQVDGNTRKLAAAGGTIVETLVPSPSPSSYSYTLAGLAGVQSFQGQFATAVVGNETQLTWTASFSCGDNASAVKAVGFIAAAAERMKSALMEYFGPRS